MLWRQYGAVGIGTYFGIYFGSIAFFYVVYDYGVLTNLPSGGTAVIEHVSDYFFCWEGVNEGTNEAVKMVFQVRQGVLVAGGWCPDPDPKHPRLSIAPSMGCAVVHSLPWAIFR